MVDEVPPTLQLCKLEEQTFPKEVRCYARLRDSKGSSAVAIFDKPPLQPKTLQNFRTSSCPQAEKSERIEYNRSQDPHLEKQP